MAGDWIKFEVSTPNKPEVWEMAHILSLDPDAVVGKLLRVWAWFDSHSHNGHAASVTKVLLNRDTGVPNFCEAMIQVGWLTEENGWLVVTNFDRHNGETAKKRALSTRRKQKSRNGHTDVTDESQECHAESVTKARPEKRREEKSKEEDSRREADASLPSIWDQFESVGGERSLLGKLIKDCGEEEVSRAVFQVVAKRPADPNAYIRGIVKAKKSDMPSFAGYV